MKNENYKSNATRTEQLQEYADIACALFEIAKVNVHVKDISGGRVRYKTRFISIPLWTYTDKKYPKDYPLYYLLHEVAHIIDHDYNGSRYSQGRKQGHDTIYKSIEIDLLSLAGISITYKKAYPDSITSNGQTHKV